MLFFANTIFFQKKQEISKAQRKRLTIEETQRSLPIFPFKDDLIAAIKEHQVRELNSRLSYALFHRTDLNYLSGLALVDLGPSANLCFVASLYHPQTQSPNESTPLIPHET